MSPFTNIEDPTIPKKPSDDPFKDAHRCEAHKEDVSKPLSTINNTMKSPPTGKMGLKGDGRQV